MQRASAPPAAALCPEEVYAQRREQLAHTVQLRLIVKEEPKRSALHQCPERATAIGLVRHTLQATAGTHTNEGIARAVVVRSKDHKARCEAIARAVVVRRKDHKARCEAGRRGSSCVPCHTVVPTRG